MKNKVFIFIYFNCIFCLGNSLALNTKFIIAPIVGQSSKKYTYLSSDAKSEINYGLHGSFYFKLYNHLFIGAGSNIIHSGFTFKDGDQYSPYTPNVKIKFWQSRNYLFFLFPFKFQNYKSSIYFRLGFGNNWLFSSTGSIVTLSGTVIKNGSPFFDKQSFFGSSNLITISSGLSRKVIRKNSIIIFGSYELAGNPDVSYFHSTGSTNVFTIAIGYEFN